jgi:hypothetical protein
LTFHNKFYYLESHIGHKQSNKKSMVEPAQGKQKGKAKERPKNKQPIRTKKKGEN